VDEPFETFGHTIEALEPNTTYNIRAVATNSGIGGTGQSERHTFTTPPEDIITVPTAPLNLSATPGSGQVALSWSAPVSDGGAAITRYEVSVNDGLWAATQTMTGHTVTGLSSRTHTFRVRAVNAQGAGLPASVTIEVTYEVINPPTIGPPRYLSATVEGNSVTLRWVIPLGETIMGLSYEISVNNGTPIAVLGNATERVFTDLAPGDYTFRIRARRTVEGNVVVSAWATAEATIAPLPAPTLTLPADTWNPARDAANETFMVVANREWTATVSAPPTGTLQWLSISGTTADSITLAVTANATGAQRVGTVTVSIPGTNLSRTLTVTQGPGEVFTITLNPNGGTVSPQSVTVTGNTVGNVLPTPTRPGFQFAGWFTAPTGTTQVLPTTEVTGSTTIFARWNVNITLNPNGGGIDADDRTMTLMAGSIIPELPVPTEMPAVRIPAEMPYRRGYVFDGWRLPNGELVTETCVVLNQHHTLTAAWSMIWHCDSDRVAFWPGEVNLYRRILGTPSDGFRTRWNGWVDNAITAWSHADVLDINIGIVTSASEAQIRTFGGQGMM